MCLANENSLSFKINLSDYFFFFIILFLILSLVCVCLASFWRYEISFCIIVSENMCPHTCLELFIHSSSQRNRKHHPFIQQCLQQQQQEQLPAFIQRTKRNIEKRN